MLGHGLIPDPLALTTTLYKCDRNSLSLSKPARPLDIEQVLLTAKIDIIIAHLKTGTLIYTHYFKGMVEPLRKAIAVAGYKVGLFTGVEDTQERDSSKKKFIAREIDILIGTAPIGTGVDGLQYVRDRLIIASIP
jgi:superfamily II DNA helicase RecQ